MEQIFKTLTGLTLIFLMTFSGIGIITASIDASNAENFASTIASVVESGNYSETVINDCKTKATEAKYILTVDPLDLDGDGYYDVAEVIVEYDYSIPILNITGTKHEARTFAR